MPEKMEVRRKMFIEISEQDRIVYYWLSKEEKADEQLRESIKPEQVEWTKKGYAVCTFLSGTEDLVECTKELLIHNLHVLALEESKNKSRCLADSIEDFQRKFAMGKDLYERQ